MTELMIASRSRTASGLGVLLDFWVRQKWLTPVVGLLGVLIFFAFKSDNFVFIGPDNMRIVAAQTAQVGVCAIGMTFIMIGGGIERRLSHGTRRGDHGDDLEGRLLAPNGRGRGDDDRRPVRSG
jgi:hypothetical protein